MSKDRCRYCGLIHRSAGDECHPDVNRLLDMIEDVEDRLRTLRCRVREWTQEYGAALCPGWGVGDTYGEGMRAAKDQVRAILVKAEKRL